MSCSSRLGRGSAVVASILALPLGAQAGILGPFIRGDANLDGEVSLADASYIVDVLAGLRPPIYDCQDAADADDDGQNLPGDVVYLLQWFFVAGAEPPRPPFPLAGTDPTADPLLCAQDLTALVHPDPAFTLSWSQEIVTVVPGATDVEVFLLATTGTPVECLSLAYRLNRSVVENPRVDLEGTILPPEIRERFQSSLFFQVQATTRPGYDLLHVGAIFVDELTGTRVPFAATEGPVDRAPLLRVLLDLRPEAVLEDLVAVLTPALESDLTVSPHGIRSEFCVDGRPRRPAAQGQILFGWPGAGEFLRGDCDGDGRLLGTVTDAFTNFQYCFRGGSVNCVAACDADGDGSACSGVTDGLRVLNYIFRGGPAPPAPFPECGKSPSGYLEHYSRLGCEESGCRG